MYFFKSSEKDTALHSIRNDDELKESPGMWFQSLGKIRHCLTMLYSLQNSRLELMMIIIKAIVGLKIVLTP